MQREQLCVFVYVIVGLPNILPMHAPAGKYLESIHD